MKKQRTAEIDPVSFVGHFRASAPYIHAHRGRTFVLSFPGEAVARPGFTALLHDIALLHSLGVRLVLVHGARPQIDKRLREAKIRLADGGGRKVLDPRALACVKEAVGALRVDIESLLSMGLPSSPMAGARLRVASGNFVVAQPLGVVDGVDLGHAGEVRRVDAEGMKRRLDSDAVVLVSPLGQSITGEVFDVDQASIAWRTATALHADKLIVLVPGRGLVDSKRRPLTELTPDEAAEVLSRRTLAPELRAAIESAIDACRVNVRRAHILPMETDGALLLELFTRDGVGTLITGEQYEGIRRARHGDVAALLELLRPLEEQGLLLRRPREILETEIDRFSVVERDGLVVACAALHPYPEDGAGELACVAVDPRYRDAGRGEALLSHLEKQARRAGLDRIFVLTTRASHWFRERGFEPGRLADVPKLRRNAASRKRKSKVLVKDLSGRAAGRPR